MGDIIDEIVQSLKNQKSMGLKDQEIVDGIMDGGWVYGASSDDYEKAITQVFGEKILRPTESINQLEASFNAGTAFRPHPTEKPRDGYYWRIIKGKMIPFMEGMDFDEQVEKGPEMADKIQRKKEEIIQREKLNYLIQEREKKNLYEPKKIDLANYDSGGRTEAEFNSIFNNYMAMYRIKPSFLKDVGIAADRSTYVIPDEDHINTFKKQQGLFHAMYDQIWLEAETVWSPMKEDSVLRMILDKKMGEAGETDSTGYIPVTPIPAVALDAILSHFETNEMGNAYDQVLVGFDRESIEKYVTHQGYAFLDRPKSTYNSEKSRHMRHFAEQEHRLKRSVPIEKIKNLTLKFIDKSPEDQQMYTDAIGEAATVEFISSGEAERLVGEMDGIF